MFYFIFLAYHLVFDHLPWRLSFHILFRSEYDNGRLLRLLLKLGALNERPDQSGGEWAETGERYILKLFRDYCFHQVFGEGGAYGGML